MNIIVCDDHPVVRAGLAKIVVANLKAVQVREADTGQALLDLVRLTPSDVVLLDVGLPGRGGLEVLRQVKKEQPQLPVLMLSVHPAEQYAVRALRAGASGYLTKDLAADELVNAIRTVLGGRRYLTPDVVDRLAADLEHSSAQPLHDSLSDREFEVICLLAAGRSVKEIAAELSLSYNTINTYRSRVLIKLAVKTNAEIIRYALAHRLIE